MTSALWSLAQLFHILIHSVIVTETTSNQCPPGGDVVWEKPDNPPVGMPSLLAAGSAGQDPGTWAVHNVLDQTEWLLQV